MAKKKSKRKSRAIVIGHLERVSRGIFDKYQKQITDIIKGHHGVYALYRDNKLYYIGQAGNLRNRIKHHLKDKHSSSWNYFSLYVFRNESHIRELEALLLRIAYPKGNKQRGKLKQSKDLKPILKRQVKKEQDKERDDLFKTRKPSAKKKKKSKKKTATKTDRPLKGVFPTGKVLYGTYKGKNYKAWVNGSGTIKYDGQYYDSPSTVGAIVRGGKATNGWRFWKYKNKSGELVCISELRK